MCARVDEIVTRVSREVFGKLQWRAFVLKVQGYSIEDLFSHDILIVIPFYFMRYRDELDEIAVDEERCEAFLDECETFACTADQGTGYRGKPKRVRDAATVNAASPMSAISGIAVARAFIRGAASKGQSSNSI